MHARLRAAFVTRRPRATEGGYSHGTPPAYEGLDADAVTAVRRVRRGRVHVLTHVKGDVRERLFVVLRTRDGWRIDSLKDRVRGKRLWDSRSV